MRGLSMYILCIVSFFLGCTITVNILILGDQSSCSLAEVSTEHFAQFSQTVLIILIISSPNNIVERNAMRETWLSLLDTNYHKVYFVIGTNGASSNVEANLASENLKNKDLLLLSDVQDSYSTLTQKVLGAFKRINSSSFKYVLKCDDDTYVNVKEFVQELKTLEASGESLYWGYFKGDAKVQRIGQWKETEWNICDRYIPYALGGGYVLSKDLITFIVNNIKHWRQFHSEDVSVGAWLGLVKTNRKHDVRFNTEYRSRGCLNSYLVMHKQTPQDMKELHKNLLMTGQLCTVEKVITPHFNYNWSVLPSRCCSNFFKTNRWI